MEKESKKPDSELRENMIEKQKGFIRQNKSKNSKKSSESKERSSKLRKK